jgi:hypothetical protein
VITTSLTLALLARLLLNSAAVVVIVRAFLYPVQRDRELAFSLFMFGLTIFLVAHVLRSLSLSAGFSFGLFAVFGLLRYRTEGISNKALTYLFIVAALALLNAVGDFTWLDLVALNALVVLATGLAENGRLLGLEPLRRRDAVRHVVQYERIDLIVPARREELIRDLEARTGWRVTRVEVDEVDFVRDTASLRVYHARDDAGPGGPT